jgi:hypothetical protein
MRAPSFRDARMEFVRPFIFVMTLPLVVSCGSSPVADEEPEAEVAQASAPAPAPAGLRCTLPRGTGSGTNCPRYEEGDFVVAVDAAIDRVIAKHPEYFNVNDKIGTGQPKIVNPNAYLNAVPQELEAAGYCSIFDGEEIAVKNTNNYSEQYHVWYSSFYVRRGGGAYRATCTPAWF